MSTYDLYTSLEARSNNPDLQRESNSSTPHDSTILSLKTNLFYYASIKTGNDVSTILQTRRNDTNARINTSCVIATQ